MQQSINQRLKFLREQKGVIMEEVAEATGINMHTLYTYESLSRASKPRPNNIKALANYYGVTIHFLIHGTEEKSIEPRTEEIPKWGKELMEKIEKLMQSQTEQQSRLLQIYSKFWGNQMNGDVIIPSYKMVG